MDNKSTKQKIFSAALDMIFPRSCLGCAVLLPISSADSYLCQKCLQNAAFNTASRCAFCPRAVTLWQTCDRCAPKHSLDALLVAGEYADPLIKSLVKTLKYRLARSVADDIGQIMARYFEQRASLVGLKNGRTIITSVPLHPKRLRWRGFNQAALIADAFASHFDLPVRHDLLQRVRSQKPQADIKNREERIKNASGIFTVLEDRPQGIILLVDDVATTSATLDQAAKVLKSAGVTRVIGFVFARN